MQKLTAGNLAVFINQLKKDNAYNYLHGKNNGLIQVVEVRMPEGPILIKRWNPSKGENSNDKKVESISTELLWRIANSFVPESPINIDRILGGSYNTRSVLESLLLHTPQFYYCYPGRIEDKGGTSTIKKGHKHMIWKPKSPHEAGKMAESKTEIVISEIPSTQILYDSLSLPPSVVNEPINIDIQRRHAQIQIALYFIGKQLNFKTWIAQNDKGIIYQNKKLGEYDGIIQSLRDEKLMSNYEDAVRAALLIDCIWFKSDTLMPAVMEVEHSTGVTSGLARMKNFKDKFPPYPTRYVIVAPDDDRDKVFMEANKPQFHDLNTKFFPYSAVEELYGLCHKRKIKGVTEDFLDCYMETILIN